MLSYNLKINQLLKMNPRRLFRICLHVCINNVYNNMYSLNNVYLSNIIKITNGPEVAKS